MTELKCELCNFTAAATAKYSHLCSLHADNKSWQCSYPGCGYKANLRQQLKRHSRSHESKPELRKPFRCIFKGCDYGAARKTELDSHVYRRHTADRTKDFSCVMCPSKFYTQPELNKHIRTHVKEKVFECDYCNYKSSFGPYLRKHIQHVHEKSVLYKCSELGCDFSSSYKLSLRKHLKTHNPDLLTRRPFPCTSPDCKFRATTRPDLKMHVQRRHNPNRAMEFTCQFCSKKYLTKEGVDYHVRVTHLKENCYKCDKCSYATANEAQLKIHCERVHDDPDAGGIGTLGYNCKSCGYSCLSNAGLLSHMRNQHPEDRDIAEQQFEVLACPEQGCKYRTDSKRHLNRHLKTHKILRSHPFPCSFPSCEYRASDRHRLNVHFQQQHNPNRQQFPCTLCPKTFFSRLGASYHLKRTHLKEKPFQCDKCNYRTVTPAELKHHNQRVHDNVFGIPKFSCKTCGYRSTCKAGLESHIRQVNCKEWEVKCFENSSKASVKKAASAPADALCKIPVVLLNQIVIQLC